MLNLSTAERLTLLKLARATAPMRASATLSPIEHVDRSGPLPVSLAQQRLWLIEQVGGADAARHISTTLRLKGTLDRHALVRALDRIVVRHEALRTTFDVADGEPVQRIAPAERSCFLLLDHDLSGNPAPEAELRRLIAEEAGAPFDLARGPLVRGRLIRRAGDDHVLLVTMHHIVSDGWSTGVFTRELTALYEAFREGELDPLPPLPVQYADYAAWQRRWVSGKVLEAQAEYWKKTLTGAPELLELPTDRPRPAQMDHAGAQLRVELDDVLTAGLNALGRRHGTTLFMTLLAGWAIVLSRLSGQDDVVIGTPMAGRGRREIEGLIGFFVNTLAVRVDLSRAPTVAEMLARVKQRVLDAQQHQDVPFEQVVELVDPVRSLAHHPLFQAVFIWQNTPRGDERGLPALAVGGVGATARTTTSVDLSLALQETRGRIVGSVTYATALFDRTTAERYVGYLRRALEGMVADESRHVERLALMPESERARVVEEWNRTRAEYPIESCVQDLFEAHVERTPDAVAVVVDREHLTYEELNQRANRLAHYLRSLAVGPDVRVGICVERSLAMVVGTLGVLKAGGAYVPLDPSYPAERLAFMLADSAPAVVLRQGVLAKDAAGVFAGLRGDVPVLEVDAAAPVWADQPATNPERGRLTPGDLAYVIYTSGSTGRPKGVAVSRRNVVSMLTSSQATWGLAPGDALLHKMSVSFDVSVREIYWPLTAGARVVVARPGAERDIDDQVATILRERIAAIIVQPVMLQLLLRHEDAARCRALRVVLAGGEPLLPGLAREFYAKFPAATLYHMYGPTEATIAAAGRLCTPDEAHAGVPIGRPIDNTRIYVLDGAGEPVPVGVAGELCIGGAGVARGYLGQPRQTAEQFAPDPFGGEPGARLYRTGDLARWRPDGTIEFLGRTGDQVKIRGYRIELREIEVRLAEHAAVREAVVVAREDTPGDARLVAYWSGQVVKADTLRRHLEERLPSYMVPAAYVRLEQFPRSPNGKLDRKALPAPQGDAFAVREYEPPETETEQAVAEIWAEVLGVEQVGRRDNFFDLGGHSALAVQVLSRVRETLAEKIPTGGLFARPVLAEFALELETAAQAEPPQVDGDALKAHAEYWTTALRGAPALLELPTDHPRPAQQDYAGARVGVELDEQLTAELRTLSRRHRATLFMTLLTGWGVALGRLSGSADVVIGTPAAIRRPREIEGPGFWVNTLALRLDLSGAPTVAELVARAKERALDAQHHRDIPFEQVVELVQPARSLSHTPIFQVMFVWQNAPGSAARPRDASEAVAKFDLTLTLAERDGRIVGSLTYATALFERQTVERYAGCLRRVFEEMVADDMRRVDISQPTIESPAVQPSGSEREIGNDRAIAIRPAGSQPPLFLVHDGTGSTAYAQVLHPHISGDIPVYALPSPPSSEPPPRTVEGMATRLVRMIREVQPSGPYRVTGWSFGGILAYEIATQLLGQDDVVEFVGMLDTLYPARSSAASDDAVHEHALLHHKRALREYVPGPIPVTVHLFPARQSSNADTARDWRAILSEKALQVTAVPGTHLSMMQSPNVESLGGALSQQIERARQGAKTPPGKRDSPVLKLQRGKPGVAPTFCVPGAGTSVTSFIELIGSVDSSWPLYGLQPRGMDGTTVPHSSVVAAAKYYLSAMQEEYPEGPIHLLGHSYGGWIVFEMALRLREAGRPVASLTILDSDVPESDGYDNDFDSQVVFLKLVEVLELSAERSFGIGSADVDSRDEAGRLKLLHQKMVQHGLLTTRSTDKTLYGPFRTFARCLRNTYRPSGVYPDRLRLVLVKDPRKDEDTNREQFAETVGGWRQWAPGLVFSTGAGNHMTALKSPYVATLAAYLADDRRNKPTHL